MWKICMNILASLDNCGRPSSSKAPKTTARPSGDDAEQAVATLFRWAGNDPDRERLIEAGPYRLSAVQPSCRYLQTGTDPSEKQASPFFRARRQRPFAFIEDENRQVWSYPYGAVTLPSRAISPRPCGRPVFEQGPLRSGKPLPESWGDSPPLGVGMVDAGCERAGKPAEIGRWNASPGCRLIRRRDLKQDVLLARFSAHDKREWQSGLGDDGWGM